MAKSSKNDASASGGTVGTVASLIASAALAKSAFAARDEPVPTSGDDLQGLAEHLSVAEPDGGVARVRYRFEHYQRGRAWLAFPLAVVRKFLDDKAGLLAALIAYFGFFSIFPLMLAFTSILGFVLDPDQQARFADEAASQIPVIGDTIVKTVENNGEIGTSPIPAIIGIAVALWSGLKMIDAMQNALNDVWDIAPVNRPNLIMRRARSLLMLVVLGGGIIGSVVVSSLATYLDGIPGIGRLAIWAGSAGVSMLVYLLAFQLLTDRPIPWRALLPGAAVGGVAWWALQTFGTPLVQRVNESSDSFGEFGAIIALMTFFYIAAQVSIFAAEINVVRHLGLWPRSFLKGDLTVADLRAYELLAASTRMDPSYDVEIVPSTASRRGTESS